MRMHKLDFPLKRLVSLLVSASIAATFAPFPMGAAHAADSIQTLATSYQPTLSETVDASGFRHPGIGFTKEMLENMRAQVRAQKEPWNTYFNSMLLSAAASKTPAIKNVSSDPTLPRYYGLATQGMNSLFIADANVVYTQAVLYYVTGDETYRANAMRIIRLYEKMDPAQYVYFTDSHIHTGIPLQKMVSGAEILRYTSTQTPALAWTDDDTAKFTSNLVVPVVQTFNSCNCRFMNQHLYTTIAAMTGSIFAEDRDTYNKAVEWFTVNKDAVDQGQNGAIKRLFRLVTRNDLTGEEVTPAVQHVEMGRDQAHGGGDITNAGILARLMMAQGTKVDPVEGTVSAAENAVGPYEFLNDRILDATEQFGAYMTGVDIPWVPTASHTDEAGNPTIVYKNVSWAYRGRSGSNQSESFYYYRYTRGVDMTQRAPNFTKFFVDRAGYGWDSGDGGGDFWIGIPKAAEAEGATYLAKPTTDPYREVEDRYRSLDSRSVVMSDGSATFIRATAAPEGTKVSVYASGYGATYYGIRIRTNGTALMDNYGRSIPLPDTHGEWRYVIFTGNVDDFIPLTFTGNGTTVDVDHVNVKASTLLTPPVFTVGTSDELRYSYAGTTLPVTLDLSATDPGAGEVVTYQADNLPAGASFSTATGAFSWNPTQAGTYTFSVGASDGTTVTMKRITVVVDASRQGAVDRAIAAYKAGTPYVESTLPAYNAAYADMMSVIGSASDDVYYQKLAALRTAAAGLQEINPLLSDGSLDFRNMFVTSTFGTLVGNLVDDSQDTGGGWGPNLTHQWDFGPSFKVAANDFKTRTVGAFPERTGGAAIFGSNDNENWTRLTPGLTTRVDNMQDMPVSDEVKNLKFRFFKMQMLEPFVPVYQPFAILEMTELRIFGTRYATVNKLTSVSMSSDQALRKRVVAGNTVKLTFNSSEAINNVVVTVQGQPATVTTTDNLNWTASWVVNGSAPAGAVKFLVNYKTADGVDAEPTLFTTDASSLFVADETGLISNPVAVTTVADSSGRTQADLITVAGYLFDNNLNTGTDFRVSGSGYGAWVSFDFKGGGTVKLSKAEIIARQDTFYGRVGGAVIQGSNDNATWETITNAAVGTLEWQTLTSTSSTPYRYVRVWNGGNWYGNMNELKLYGVIESSNLMSTASISSSQALRTRIVPGNTVKLAFAAKEAVKNVTATIQGVPATVTTTDNVNFVATALLPQGTAPGQVKFEVKYDTAAGKTGYPLSAVSDGSVLYLVDEADVIKNVTGITTLIDTTAGRTAAQTTTIMNYLFDANAGTGTDIRLGTNGAGGSITFDFKAGNQATLTGVELLARQDSLYTRAKYTIVQGSNDNSNWTTLTTGAAATPEWQTFPVTGGVPYRYIKIWNATTWYGNINEVRFHGTVQGADTAAPVTTDNAPKVPVNVDTTVSFAVADSSSGVAATYYKVNGGAQQAGNAVALSAEGTYALSYWSVDKAGNIEQPHGANVTIDKSAPVTTVTSNPAAPANGWYSSDVILSFAAADANSGATTYFKVDGGVQQGGGSVVLSGKGTHTVEYASVDQAGNAEAARTVAINIGPIDLSASVKFTQNGATLNRATGKYVGSVTVTNNTGSTLASPLQVKLGSLTGGVTLDNASGYTGGEPYVTLPSSLSPGASVNVQLTFSNPARTVIGYAPSLFKGNF
ncbi:discoidin domain-containing protein [Pseudoduganella sp. LjRoot289]|uniref:OmpL47-type beta-barrel domain-containing protein n=1 Tax=Pseudoduganella sp. LjRoot289 TaxID=3342314 RepID=UPI003ECF5090